MIRKYSLIIVIMLLTGVTARPQSISQLIEQLTLDTQKLSGLRSILKDMITSYTLIRNGYEEIKGIAKGNFRLHQSYLDGLWIVSRAVREDPAIHKLLNNGGAIFRLANAISHGLQGNTLITPAEQGIINNQLSTYVTRCNSTIQELSLIITDSQVRMDDAQRMEVIGRLNQSVSGQLRGLNELKERIDIESLRRLKELNDIAHLKQLYGIH